MAKLNYLSESTFCKYRQYLVQVSVWPTLRRVSENRETRQRLTDLLTWSDVYESKKEHKLNVTQEFSQEKAVARMSLMTDFVK
jgi:hypothetical protein